MFNSSSSSSCSVVPETHSRLSLADFELLKLIGKGHSGRVYLARDQHSGEPVAIKVIKKGQGHDGSALHEQQIQRDLSGCSFLLPLWASWHDADNFYLVTRYLGGHDLGINLAVKTRFSEERARFYTAELLIALEQMKTHMVLHRDIKPANIVFTSNGHIRVIDLGLATTLKASPNANLNFIADPNAVSGSFKINDPDYTSAEQVGTPPFMSPDVHLGRPYSFEADLHALGVTLYNMLTGRLPFGEEAQSQDEILEAVLCQQLTFRSDDAVSPEARDLLSQLLRRDSKKPAFLEDVMCHPWFYPIRWDQIRNQAISPRWKPHSTPLPKSTTVCTLTEGAPCSPDPYPDFTYISPEFLALRSREKSIWKKLGALFSGPGDRSPTPATPPASPVQSVHTPNFSSDAPSPPPNIPLPPLPNREAVDPMVLAMLSCPGPVQLHSPGAGGVLPPLIIRQKLARRAPPPAVPRPIRGDMTKMPEVTITPPDSEDEVQEMDSRGSPLRPPFTEVFDQHLLSPMDADRPAFNPVKVGPRIKLSAPPKRVKRAQKENAVADGPTDSPSQAPQPQVQVGPKLAVVLDSTVASKPGVSRSPPTAVFMIPPKVVPLPTGLPNPPTIRIPPPAILKPKAMPKPSMRTSPSKSASPKVKPASKVPSQVPNSRSKQRQVMLRRRTSAATRTTASPLSACPPDFSNVREGIYPRAMVREKTLSHPALAFANAKERPQDYPRPPQMTEVKSASMKQPSVEDILPPPPSQPGLQETPKNVALVPVNCTRPCSKDIQVSSLSIPESSSLVAVGAGFDGHMIMKASPGFNDWCSFFAKISTALRCLFSWVRSRGAPPLHHL